MIASGERSKMKGVQKLTVAALSAIGAVLNSDNAPQECESKNNKVNNRIKFRKNYSTSSSQSMISNVRTWQSVKSNCAKMPCKNKNDNVNAEDYGKCFVKDTKYKATSRSSSYNSTTSCSTRPSFLTQLVTGVHNLPEREFSFCDRISQRQKFCKDKPIIDANRKTICDANFVESQSLKSSRLMLEQQSFEKYDNEFDLNVLDCFDSILKTLHPRIEDSLNAKLFNEDVIQRYIEFRQLYFELCAALIGKAYLSGSSGLLTCIKGRKKLNHLFQKVSGRIEALAPCVASYSGTASAIDKHIRNEPVICLVEKCRHKKEHKASRPMKGGSTIFGFMGSLYPHHPVWEGSYESAVFRDITFEEFLATAIQSSRTRTFFRPISLDSSKRFQLQCVNLVKSAFDFCFSCGICRKDNRQKSLGNFQTLYHPDERCLATPKICKVVKIPLCSNCFC